MSSRKRKVPSNSSSTSSSQATTILLGKEETNHILNVNFINQWNALSWNTQHYLREAKEFFALHNCSSYINNMRSQLSACHKIAIVKIIFYVITTLSFQQLRQEASNLEEEEIALFSRCVYIVNILGKKNLDPTQKDHKRVKWNNIEPLLSINEVLFFWFIFKYEIGHYFQKKEEEIETRYFRDKQGRGSALTKTLKRILQHNQSSSSNVSS